MSASSGSVLVVDVGTSGVRAAIVRPDATVANEEYVPVLPDSPAPGLVEFDAVRMADAVLEVATAALADGGPVAAVGIANQRASVVVWERASGKPVGPGIGWQDLRTVGTCLTLQAEGIYLAPNASATKVMAILDEVDPQRTRAEAGELCFGTVDSWVAWTLSGGGAGSDTLHVTDATNAGVTALVDPGTIDWDLELLAKLRIPAAMLPVIVDSSGAVGDATALPGAPLICGIAGDQQASLVGQGATLPGLAKATFGTGGMLDQCTGPGRGPGSARRGGGGTFPIVAFRVGGHAALGHRGGDALRRDVRRMAPRRPRAHFLRPGVGRRGRAVREHRATCGSSRRCSGSGRRCGTSVPVARWSASPGDRVGAQIVRAVLEGVAHRGADLVEASEADSGYPIGCVAHRRRHVGQRRIRPGPGRRHRTAHRDLADPRGDHARSRAAGWPRHRDLCVDGRARHDVHPEADGRTGGRGHGPDPVEGTLVGGTGQVGSDHPRTVRPVVLNDLRRCSSC